MEYQYLNIYLHPVVVIASNITKISYNPTAILRRYMDDFKKIQIVFTRLQNAGLKMKREKCQFLQKSLKYLDHIIDETGLHTDSAKVSAIKDVEPPNNTYNPIKIIFRHGNVLPKICFRDSFFL